MGKARVYGSNCNLLLFSNSLNLPIPLGEFDSFHASSLTTIHKSRPIGYIKEAATTKYGGWDLSFSGGKIDWSLAHFYWLQDVKLLNGNSKPKFYVIETIKHYNGDIESYTYEDVVIFGFENSIDDSGVQESIKGFSPSRRLGIIDTTYDSPTDKTNLYREGVFNSGNIISGILGALDAAKNVTTNVFNNLPSQLQDFRNNL